MCSKQGVPYKGCPSWKSKRYRNMNIYLCLSMRSNYNEVYLIETVIHKFERDKFAVNDIVMLLWLLFILVLGVLN